MQNFIKKASELVASYNKKLAAYGIAIELSRKYSETKVEEYSPSHPSLIDYAIQNRAKKQEKKKLEFTSFYK